MGQRQIHWKPHGIFGLSHSLYLRVGLYFTAWVCCTAGHWLKKQWIQPGQETSIRYSTSETSDSPIALLQYLFVSFIFIQSSIQLMHSSIQALMELGAIVCTPRKPSCQDCPLNTICGAFHLVCGDKSEQARIAGSSSLSGLQQEGSWEFFHSSALQSRGLQLFSCWIGDSWRGQMSVRL